LLLPTYGASARNAPIAAENQSGVPKVQCEAELRDPARHSSRMRTSRAATANFNANSRSPAAAFFIEGAPQEVESNRSGLAGIRRVCGGV